MHQEQENLNQYITAIEDLWQIRDQINADSAKIKSAIELIDHIMNMLESGEISVCSKDARNQWQVHHWIKKAILLGFRVWDMKHYGTNDIKWYDKIDPQFNTDQKLLAARGRMVPGSIIRKGSYIGNNAVIMPSFINIGAHVGDNTLVDTWATIGSCAYVGKNCHISGGTGIAGILEPFQSQPVIIEDNCFIGARSEIAEGVTVQEGAVISMGVFITASTKIVDRATGKIIYGTVPPYSVVVPGSLPGDTPDAPHLYCAVIVKQVDKKTREKTAINDLLRN